MIYIARCKKCNHVYSDEELQQNKGLCPNCGANKWEEVTDNESEKS